MDSLSLSWSTLWLLSALLGLLWAVQKTIEFRKALSSVNHHPGPRKLLPQTGFLGNALPSIRGVSVGPNWSFEEKHKFFQAYGWNVVANVSAFPTVVCLNIADAAVIKEIVASRARFPKPVEHYSLLRVFGNNIIASEFEEWKKYRKISAPAFSDRNNRLVWDETVKIMDDLFNTLWLGKESITVDHCVEVTLPIALFVIGVAGFGRRISWLDDDKVPPGHRMTFKDALHVVSTDIFIRLVLPMWAMGLTRRTQNTKKAFEELDMYMKEMIEERKKAEKVERYDLFSSLLDANEGEHGAGKLSLSEVVGNVFIFLVAGHETTAHTLCFTFAMLALYPDQQEILYHHVKTVLSKIGRLPTFDDMPLFTQSMAVFYETLRMFPPVNHIPKYSAEDTVFNVTSADGTKTTTVPVLQGTQIMINVPGLHYNPLYWEDPETFNPARFLGDWPRDAFLPFSGGARACIGRKFFETEGIAILTMLISQYKIEVKEEPQFAAETFEQRRDRILLTTKGLTLTPIRMPLVFKRR